MSPSSNDKEYKAQELIDQALLEWHYYQQRITANNRYNASVGRYITKDYFIECPIKCVWQSAGCMQRFKTPEEAQRHRYRHGG
jgi:hypothetical protein